MLGDRHQLDVREPERGDVVGELWRQLPVGQHPPVGMAAPRSEVHLVHAHAVAHRVDVVAARHPVAVVPRMLALEHDARHAAGVLGELRHRIGAVDRATVGARDRVLVRRARADLRHEPCPHPASTPLERAGGRSHPLNSPTTLTRRVGAPTPRSGHRRLPHGLRARPRAVRACPVRTGAGRTTTVRQRLAAPRSPSPPRHEPV